MHLKRTATIVVAGAACAAWLAAAATSSRREDAPAAPAPPVRDARAETLATSIARLHDRLRPMVAPRQAHRNPFEFATLARRPSAAPAARSAAALSEASPVTRAPVAAPLTLEGIAEDAGPNGPVRTAIISTAGNLFLVKTGETVTPQYRVTNVDADSVELVDTVSGATLRFALK